MSHQILIAISPEGKYYLNNQPVEEAVLREALAVAGEQDADQGVLLISDEETPLKYVTQAWDWCRANQLNRVKLKSR
jgi:biopolymer transport protein ExbD